MPAIGASLGTIEEAGQLQADEGSHHGDYMRSMEFGGKTAQMGQGRLGSWVHFVEDVGA